MAALPFLVSLGLGLAVCPALLRAMRRRGSLRRNHRGLAVAHPAGLALVATSVAALAVLLATDRLAGLDLVGPEAMACTAFVAGVALLGLVDDVLGDRGRAPRGLRAHGRALAAGRASTGVAKAVGTALLSVTVVTFLGLRGLELALAAWLLTLATHVFNLLDLRPGRSIKSLLPLVAVLTLGSWSLAPLAALGLVLGPILVLLVFDLRERAMLGDTGAGAVGAVAGLALVLTLPPGGQAIALLALGGLTVYGELRSISALVERRPILRRIDSLGRCG